NSFFFQAEDGIRYRNVTGVQTCALPILIIMYITSFIISFLIISNDWVYIVPICIILCRKCFTYTGISVTNPHIFILSAIITKFFKSTVLLCFNKSFISHFYTSLVLTFLLVLRYYLMRHLIVWDD